MFRLNISVFVVIALLFSGCKNQGINSIEGNDNPKSLGLSSPANKGNIVSEPLGSQLKSSDGSPLVNRVMSLSDPMRDPNWDWTKDTKDTLYIISYDEPKEIRRPYYGSSSIKPFFTGDDGTRDIWPKDGWELLLRDFGTSQYQVSIPFYILYNKHMGILRYIYFGNLLSDQINHATATLSIKGSVTSPFFTLTDSSSQFVNNYTIYKQHTISKYYQDQWNVMDFRMAGFDPDIANKYARFIIDVGAYKNFDINANADVSLEGTIGSGGSTHSQLVKTILSGVDLYTNISKGYKDIKTAEENYEGMGGFAEEHSDAWWSGILSAAASVGATSWIPALGPAIGIAKFVMGGGSSQSRQPKPITLAGRIQLEGTIANTTHISALEFIVPGAKVNNPEQAASYNELPLNNEEPGVFNLVDAPLVEGKAYGDCINYSGPRKTNKRMPQSSSPSLVIKHKTRSLSD